MGELYDVLVIGAGMAGVTAAKAASDKGGKIGLLSKGEGASILGSGAIDVLGVVPGAEKNIPVKGVKQGIEKLLEVYPYHPYSTLAEELPNGIKAFTQLCKSGGLTFSGNGTENLTVPNTLGTVKTTAYLPYTSKDATLESLTGNVLVAGFANHSEFYPEYSSRSLNEIAENFLPGLQANFIAATLVLPSQEGKTKISNAELAQWLDTQEGYMELETLLEELLKGMAGIRHLMLPPILGYQNYEKNKDRLEHKLGIPVSELLSGGHSISGQRLVWAMRKGLELAGVEYRPLTTATNIKTQNNYFKVEFKTGKKTGSIKAKTIVLATGGFIGRGLTFYREDISAAVIEEPVGRVKPEMLQKKVFAAGGQPFTKLGLKAYSNLLLAQGSLAGRLFICGDLMEGYDWIYERSGGGVAIASGFMAGKNAAKMAKEMAFDEGV